MVSPAFGAGAFFKHAANFLVSPFVQPTPPLIRPSRRPLPGPAHLPRYREFGGLPPNRHMGAQFQPRADIRPLHRRRSHGLRANRSAMRLASPVPNRRSLAERRNLEASVNTLLRRQRSAWRRLGPKSSEDLIVWKHYDALNFDKMKRIAVAEQEEVSERVKANEDRRKRGMVHRVTLARKISKIRVLLREEEEEKRARKAEKERAAREEAERVAKAREAAIRAAKEAQERAEREAKERFEQQMKERAERLEKERAERDRIRQEKFERQRREDEREKQRFEEHLRKAKETLNNNRGGIDDHTRRQVHQRYDLYIRKWDALKAGIEPEGIEIPPLGFSQIPWPLLFCDAFYPEDITQERIKEFLFHPIHNGEGKTKRSLIRQEMVRWHPDKFNATVLVRVMPEEREAVIEGAGLVARLFNAIMAEL